MIRDLLILPDGRQLFSGAQEQVAIGELIYEREVNNAAQLDFCCAGAAMIRVRLLDTTGSFTLEPGTALRYYRVDGEENRLLMGTFYAEKPTRPGQYSVEFTAYDAMILTEKDLTAWLAALDSWPYSMDAFLEAVCQQCGLPLQSVSLCNGAHLIHQFAQPVTGRQLIAWIAEANGAVAGINGAGELVFSGYSAASRPITDGDLKSIRLSQEPCAPLDRVLIRQKEDDVGIAWPDQGTQTYIITGNPLLANYSQQLIESCAQNLCTQLQGLTYTPFEAEAFVDTPELPWQPGRLVTVQHGQKSAVCAVFGISLRGNAVTLKSVGQPSRDSAAARYGQNQVKLIQGQMNQVQVDVSGIRTQVSRVEGSLEDLQLQVREDISALQVSADKITAQVTQVETLTQTDLALVQQSVQSLKKQVDMAVSAEQVTIAVTKALEDGVKKVKTETEYTFDENGLCIADSRSDVQNRIDHMGMYVSRGEDVILQADADGVIATDVKVRNYLVVGDHARLEDYEQNRTACFWL